MNLTPSQIEQIVGEVVRRLKVQLGATAGLGASGGSGVTAGLSSSVALQEELVLTENVITLKSVEGRLAGNKRLVVRPRAIVTPAVRDELKKYKVALERRANASAQHAQVRLLVVAADKAAETALAKVSLPGSERIESQATTSLAGIVRELARQMMGRKLPAMLVTSQPFAAVVEANRLDGVRAALVTSAEQVNQASAEANVNLFVVAAKTSPFTLRKIGERVASS